MELFDALKTSTVMLMDWDVLLFLFVGLITGVWIGAIPGVSGMLAVSLMLIPSYYMTPIVAIVFLSAIYTGSIYGGGITAILLNIPGSPGAVASTFDGYELTRKGMFNEALGAGLISSAVGCFSSYFLLLFLFIPIASLVLKFGPPEKLMIIVFAIAVIGVVRGNVMQTFLGGVLGLLLGMAGSSPYGNMRGVFGITPFYDGLPLVPVLLGLFAVSELFNMVEKEFISGDVSVKGKTNIKQMLTGMTYYLHYKYTAAQSAIVGLGIGLLPAAGGSVSSVVSYALAKRMSRNSENFGKGEIEGLIAAETGNNAAEGGAVATMMAFGIPGSGIAALLMAAFMMHGMTPGAYLLEHNLDLAYAVLLINVLQALCLLFVGIIFIYFCAKVVFIPSRILVPAIGIFSILGALAIRGLMVDVGVLFVFGILGYFYRKFGYPVLSMVLGLMLGRMLEGELIRTHLLFQRDYFLILQRPIVLIGLIITVLALVIPTVFRLLKERRKAQFD